MSILQHLLKRNETWRCTSYDLFVEAWRKPKMSFFGLNFKQCMRVKKNTNKNRPLWLQFSVKRRTRECSFDEKKNIIVLKLYVLCSAAGFEKKIYVRYLVNGMHIAHICYALKFKKLNYWTHYLINYVYTYFILINIPWYITFLIEWRILFSI